MILFVAFDDGFLVTYKQKEKAMDEKNKVNFNIFSNRISITMLAFSSSD